MKLVITLCLTLFSFVLFAQAPANDDCSGLIDLGQIPYCSAPAQYTNVGATASNVSVADNIPACFNNNAERDVWFQFVIPDDGSILDVSISVFGDINGNGTLHMPQVAIYRGDCVFEGLAELDCAAAGVGFNEIHLDQFGLTPGLSYFLRINDYSTTAAANAGTFRLCIEKYVPEIIIGTVPGTASCTGTLFDSGGAAGDYSNNDDDTFTICPAEFHQCIILNVVSYETESNYDYLHIFEGNDISGLEITQLGGTGQNLEIQVPGSCATIQFTADGFNTSGGFELTWACSSSPCTAAPITTCDAPVIIPTLPYTANNLSNCLSGNTISNGPCDDDFLFGNDYIFTYASAGDECVHLSLTGTNPGAGVGIYSICPSLPGATCIASAGGGGGSIDPTIQAAFLENPGNYYLVVGSGGDCTPFNIQIDTITCPIVVPAASSCDQALNIGGCSNLVPEIIALNPGNGDPAFLQDDINAGCFLTSPGNFSFFTFTAGADGKFGFIAQSADPLETSDIDFSMWGPIDDPADICDFVSNNQPVRSSWAAYETQPALYITGMADVHPVTGLPVTDDFDCGDPSTPGPNAPTGGNADDFVSRLDVQQGKIYVILLDDFGNAIEQGGVAMDFTGTTAGVLDPSNPISASADTAVCVGQLVPLTATGGVAYFWSPSTGLSCDNCQNPVATINASATYEVQIVTACKTVTEVVNIKALQINLGPDVVVCNGANFQLNPHPFANVQYSWTGSAGLSCTDCPSPQVSGLTTGVYTFIATLTTPQCVVTDTIKVTVVNGQQPQYTIIDDQIICKGEEVNLGGPQIAGTTYLWTSLPEGLTASVPNPSASPNATTTYYLTASNGSCPVSALDSVLITVFQSPVLAVQADTAVCDGSTVLLGTTVTQPGITYVWTPNDGSLDDVDIANPIASPLQTTLYTLTATNPGCTEIRHVQVVVVPLTLQLNVADTSLLCLGGSLPIQATVSPAGTPISWTPLTNLQINPSGTSAVATPNESTLYTAQAVLPGCTRSQQIYIQVDSLPFNLAILPADTTVCEGSKVILRSATYEPADFKNIYFQWSPPEGQLTGDSLYNLVVNPTETTVYKRISTHGGCVQTDSAKVTVIPLAEMKIVPSDTTVCSGKSVQLLLTYTPGVTDIMWSPAETLSCDDCDTPTATPASTTTYSVGGTFSGCKTNTSATVNVRALPAHLFPADRMLCAGESITLNEVFDANAVYTWTSSDPAFGTVSGPQPVVTPTLSSTTYFLHADNGCVLDDQFVVTVSTGSMQASGDTTICKGVATQLTAVSTVPGTFAWNQGAGTGPVVSVAPDTTTTYTVTFTFGPGCQLTDAVTVGVAGEIAGVTFPTDVQLCPNEGLALNTTAAVPGASYFWSSIPAGFTSTLASPFVSPDTTTKYTVITTLGNCVNTQTVQVLVYNATLTVSADAIICLGDSLKLMANGTATGKYVWSTSTDSSSMVSVTPAVVGDNLYTVTFFYGDDLSCVLRDTVKVSTLNSFMVDILATPDTTGINLGESIDLFAKISPSQNLNGFQYTWKENGELLNLTTETITVQPEGTDASVSYQVEVVSPAGCTRRDEITFTLIQPNVAFPNAFTPNGDQVNGTFKMLVLEGLATVEHMEIYNRWGQKVFDSTLPNAEWDGTVDGKEAASDVYACTVRYRRGDGSLKIYVGEITLLR